MNKNYLIVLIAVIVVISVLYYLIEIFSVKEGIRGLGGGLGGGRGGGRWGGRLGGRGGGRWDGRGGYHHPGSGRRWYGGNSGYRYIPPAIMYQQYYYPKYTYWFYPSYWFGNVCKDGCTKVGNDTWGCQSPGGGVNDCVFASDCYGCGN